MAEQWRKDNLFRSPRSILAPASVALVGATDRAKWPQQIFSNLRDFGFPGPVYPINPRLSEIWGVRCWPDLAALPEPPEHAAMIVPAENALSVLKTGIRVGLKSATIYASNLGEGSDPESIARGGALRTLIERNGIRLCGPNCMGSMSLRERFFAYPNRELCAVPAGSVALVSQSGGTLQFIAKAAADRGVGFSYMLSSGNELDLDLADYIAYFVDDPHTKIIALFIEGIRRPQAFLAAAARALAARKPIVALKTGKSRLSREAALSHTGAIAGDYAVFFAMCDRYGVIACESLDDMVEILLALQPGRMPKGPRVGWVTTSGGTVDLLYDYFEDIAGLEHPDFSPSTCAAIAPNIPASIRIRNPLDYGIPSTDAKAAIICKAVLADPEIDMLAWAGVLPGGKGARDAAALKSVREASDKPVLAFSRMNYTVSNDAVAFQNEVGFPFLQGLQPTVRALAALAFYGERAGRTVAPPPPSPVKAPKLEGNALRIALAAVGIPQPLSAFAQTVEEAAAAAERIGFPVVLKIVSATVSHKTEVDGVRLDLRSAAETQDAAVSLERALRNSNHDAPLQGFLVQEMIPGVEMILGARTDPLYGPIIVLGAGGVLVELLRDIVIRLLPLSQGEARGMIAKLKASKLLRGYRGRPACDIAALERAICGLGNFYLAHRNALADIEINPLIVRPAGRGVAAVDVRLVAKD